MGEQLKQQMPQQVYHTTEPKGCKRAKHWSPEVEKNYRFQGAGYRDEHEYAKLVGPPKLDPRTGWPSKTQLKKNGYFSYWGAERECDGKYVPKVKLYEYYSTSHSFSLYHHAAHEY